MQSRYWKYMVQLKAWILYIDLYSDHSYKWDKRINIYLAITSSSSIAAWAIWSQCGFLWGFLIALSQVITAIKPHLPFAKRLESLGKITNQLQVLFNKADYDWYKVSNGELTEAQINDLLYARKKQYAETVGKALEADPLPENEQFRELADAKTDTFFQDTY